MKLTVLMPVYNEAETIEEIVRRVQSVSLEKEILITNDGSTDRTAEKLDGILNQYTNVKIFTHHGNQGKGAAIRTCLAAASGDVCLVQDADLEYHPQDYEELLKPFFSGTADAVYGVRDLSGQRATAHLGNGIITLLFNRLFVQRLSDIGTGYKVFRTSVLRDADLQANGFGFDAEITAKLAKQKRRIAEVPICYVVRTYSEGKKIKWIDGIIMIGWLVRCKFFG